MLRAMLRRHAVLLAATATLLPWGCGDGAARDGSPRGDRAPVPGAPAREEPAKLLVVATTPMAGDLVRAVAGEHAEVVDLVPRGTDPHLWTPTRSDILRLLDADAVFLNGLLLEGRAGDAFGRVEASGRPVVRLAETLPRQDLLTDPANPSQFDPHVWMDPVLWAATAPAVADALASIAPAHREEFDRRAGRLAAEADELDAEIARMTGSIPVAFRTLVTAHDAFGYFGRRYGLEVRGVQGVSTESEASLAEVEALVAFLVEARIPAVFAETTVADRSVRAIVEGAAAAGHEVRLGEPLHSDSTGPAGSPEGTWTGMLRHNARAITRALGGRP
jgi:manganese/zinc/iron transport system substrate-binding protein